MRSTLQKITMRDPQMLAAGLLTIISNFVSKKATIKPKTFVLRQISSYACLHC